MKGIALKFYFQELRKHDGKLLYEWLLETAKKMEIHGGSVFRGIAGFGHRGVVHEEHFLELGSNVPVAVTFLLSEQECAALLAKVEAENIKIFFVKEIAEFGVTQ